MNKTVKVSIFFHRNSWRLFHFFPGQTLWGAFCWRTFPVRHPSPRRTCQRTAIRARALIALQEAVQKSGLATQRQWRCAVISRRIQGREKPGCPATLELKAKLPKRKRSERRLPKICDEQEFRGLRGVGARAALMGSLMLGSTK